MKFPTYISHVGEQKSWQETPRNTFSNTEQDISKTTILLLLWIIFVSDIPSFLFWREEQKSFQKNYETLICLKHILVPKYIGIIFKI